MQVVRGAFAEEFVCRCRSNCWIWYIRGDGNKMSYFSKRFLCVFWYKLVLFHGSYGCERKCNGVGSQVNSTAALRSFKESFR